MSPSSALKARAIKKVEWCLEKVKTELQVSLHMPEVTFDLRGRTAGYAYWVRNKIHLNGYLLAKYADEFIEEVVTHEMAHLVAYNLTPRKKIKPHGNEWKQVMLFFGREPNRCHSFKTKPARRTQQFLVACACSTYTFGPTRVKRMKSGSVYRCT